ncbi:Tn3 family transposase [Legionella sp. PATHC038]|uniref:Transposase n=1 Tax=Legionella quateirensis TaxID=45072 RepID=A0A378PAN7_9GAMM|nr:MULTISPECIES: Tn3 family transposase [Legionella]KTD53859.1 Tn3 transposase DDE domain protein [Legionella quateirensis]MCW8399486.1 Tn3 family transposase [Legionella sp. PATHC038]STY82934.1 transposase [Legionella quateirensis]STY83092.1 transposase [Legionella quateirensis]
MSVSDLTMNEFGLTQEEINFIKTRHTSKQLAFALLFKYYQKSHQFISDLTKLPAYIINQVANQLNIPPVICEVSSRTYDNYLSLIRKYFKTSFSKKTHYKELEAWIKSELLPAHYLSDEEIKNQAIQYLKEKGIETFKEKTMARVIVDATNAFENDLFEKLKNSLSTTDEAQLNGLLLPYKEGLSYLGWVNKEINNPSLDSILDLMEQLSILNRFNFDSATIQLMPRKRTIHYSEAFTRFNPSDLKQMTDNKRCAHLMIHCHTRKENVIDKTIDMFNRIIRNVIHKSEKRVVRKLINDVKKVYGKDTILFNIAEVCLEQPDATIRDKIFPIVGQDKLKNIIDEYKKKGPKYQSLLHQQIRSSYATYYRRMVQPLLENIVFRSNNSEHQPILDALALIKKYFDSNKTYFPDNEEVPLDCLPDKWKKRIIDPTSGKIKRICYEVYVLKKLADRIRCREIWIESSFKHRNPDEDLPNNFEEDKEVYFDELSLPLDGDVFIEQLKQRHTNALAALNGNIPKNTKVRISPQNGGRIIVTPLTPQAESNNIGIIKKHLQEKWEGTNLIDMIKEVDLENQFTHDFISYGQKIYLKPNEISERILLSIYGMGTNVGLKHMCAGNAHVSEYQLRHIKNYFLSTDNLKNALSKVANALFKIRLKDIWGDMPIAVASDSTQFSAYFQNLISEYHNRYGGRGVMIYWHVEKNACCIHSQLKSVSSSEVSAMIEGVLRHCTEMSVQKNYVDTHGQSEVGFAFSHLLGFSLMPRLANLNKQKLAQCELGDYQKYKNLQPVLTDTINWQLIKEQYSQIVKYTAAMKAGHADPESILRRFNQNNLKHPAYLALSQLGKVLKTIFICNYLMHESIRQEIQEGLNVVELWNGVSKFIFYGRSGEISSNHEKAQTLSVLSLHLLQLSMVYINTLMIQQIIEEQGLKNKLTTEDKRALTPLIYEHVNPYGLFPLDLSTRLPHLHYGVAA